MPISKKEEGKEKEQPKQGKEQPKQRRGKERVLERLERDPLKPERKRMGRRAGRERERLSGKELGGEALDGHFQFPQQRTHGFFFFFFLETTTGRDS